MLMMLIHETWCLSIVLLVYSRWYFSALDSLGVSELGSAWLKHAKMVLMASLHLQIWTKTYWELCLWAHASVASESIGSLDIDMLRMRRSLPWANHSREGTWILSSAMIRVHLAGRSSWPCWYSSILELQPWLHVSLVACAWFRRWCFRGWLGGVPFLGTSSLWVYSSSGSESEHCFADPSWYF